MTYQVLARKWRPQTFAEIVGQEHVTTTLSNALSKERVAHAYLFTGPRGCGKTTLARLLAKALNCDEGPTPSPCGKCPSCEAVAAGTMLDVLEIDAASNTGVDNIRELRENAQYQPSAGKKRVFIIDEVHMLSKGAFNALLKTLEEPPEHVHFVFATTEPVRIPRTILSRCQRFDFRLFTLEEIRSRLAHIVAEEKFDVEEEALELLASLAEGSMRDALSLLDQGVSAIEGKLDRDAVVSLFGLVGHDRYLAFNDALVARDTGAALDLVAELVDAGHDLVEFARGLVGNFRDLMLLRLDPDLADRVEKPEAVKTKLVQQAQQFPVQDLLHLTQRAAEGYGRLERAPQPRWLLEAQVVEYTRLESQVLLSEILGRLDSLGSGGPGVGAGSDTEPKPSSRQGKGGGRGAAARVAPRPEAKAQPAAPAPPAEPPPPEADEPPPPPPAAMDESPGASLDPALRASFARLVEKARKRNMGVGTCLMEAAPRLEGDTLHLLFRPQHAFHRDQVADAKVVAWLNEIARECFGRDIDVLPRSEEPAGAEETLRQEVQREVAPTQEQTLRDKADANPALGKLIDGLGGRLVDGA